jgi:hypothetical protein
MEPEIGLDRVLFGWDGFSKWIYLGCGSVTV